MSAFAAFGLYLAYRTSKGELVMMAQTTTGGAFTSNYEDTSFIKKELMAIHSILGINRKPGSLVNLLQEMSRMVLIDDLTGLANRYYFDKRLPAEIKQAAQKNEPLSLVSLNIDQMKIINENLGFAAGDEAIRQVSSLLATKIQSVQSLLRQRYLYARYLAGQFFIVLPGTEIQAAYTGAQRLKQKIENYPFTIGEDSLNITISTGIAQWNHTMDKPEKFIESANLAMLEAQRRGGNQCVKCAQKK